eukprot:7243674-Alexandrium_andersonii.AAC.1
MLAWSAWEQLPCVAAATAVLAASRTAPKLCGLFAGPRANALQRVYTDFTETEVLLIVNISAQDLAVARWQQRIMTWPTRGCLLVFSLAVGVWHALMVSCRLCVWMVRIILSVCKTMILASPAWYRCTSGSRKGAKARREACEVASQAGAA